MASIGFQLETLEPNMSNSISADAAKVAGPLYIALNPYRITQESPATLYVTAGGPHCHLPGFGSGMFDLSICDEGICISGIDTEEGSAAGVGIKIVNYLAPKLGATLKFLSPTEAAPRCGLRCA
jgi:hypothetical protein